MAAIYILFSTQFPNETVFEKNSNKSGIKKYFKKDVVHYYIILLQI